FSAGDRLAPVISQACNVLFCVLVHLRHSLSSPISTASLFHRDFALVSLARASDARSQADLPRLWRYILPSNDRRNRERDLHPLEPFNSEQTLPPTAFDIDTSAMNCLRL